MRRRFKSKRKRHKNKLFYLLLIILLIFLIKNYIVRIKTLSSNNQFLNILLKENNIMGTNNPINNLSKYLKTNFFNDPIHILKNELKTDKKEVNTIELAYKQKEEVLVYIYNSHQGENYSKKYLEEHNITPNVLMASLMFKEKLEKRGVKTEVEESDILAYMKSNGLNHAGSYIASRHFLEPAINRFNNAKLYIDLHRDAAPHSATYTQINGKDCAKILFVIGLEYESYQNNLQLVTQINDMILKKYPSLTRGIMKKEGYGVNGVYNQDLAPNVILIEVGGNENNIDEVNNTLDLMSEIIGEYINEKKEKK